MKNARDWADELFGCDVGTADIDDIRKIQADAIRWAANLSGPLSRKAALDKADEFDPPPAK